MKPFFFLFIIATTMRASAQKIDSLKRELQIAKHDTSKLKVLVKLSEAYMWTVPDSTIYYAMLGLPLAARVKQVEDQMDLYGSVGEAWAGKGNFAVALDMNLKALRLAEKLQDESRVVWAYAKLGAVYFYAHDYPNALSYFKRTKAYPKAYKKIAAIFSGFFGETYYSLGQLDSASLYLNRSIELQPKPYWPVPFYYLGKLYAKKKMYDSSLLMFKKGLAIQGPPLAAIEGYNGISQTFLQTKNFDSAIFYAGKALVLAQQLSFGDNMIESTRLLKNAYKSLEQTDSAFKYQELMIATQDTVYSQEKVRQMEGLAFNDQIRQQEASAEQQASENRIRMYYIIGVAAVCLAIALLLWRNNRYKQRAFNLLQLQKAETDIQRDKAEKALSELKATQQQLIQSEKMASLGELTAGIAHEIQNPLNFINNFSDINTELIEELEQEADNGNVGEVKSIANDIKENEQKINHHGKRADAIVKGMLQHSRASTGKKEPTDINALADEYLRLSYHGLRAKDKDFNVMIETDFDEGIGKIKVVPQDIGRVLLNLYNNAFYAASLPSKGGFNKKPEPTVWVTTKRDVDKVMISVRDNGPGIPAKIIDKIFQPFFTTKPTGQGTGLGLSLSYDIIKAHGGELKVDTKEGEGAEFIIELPLNEFK